MREVTARIPRRLPPFFVYDELNQWADANPDHRPAVEKLLSHLSENRELEKRARRFVRQDPGGRILAIAEALRMSPVDWVVAFLSADEVP
jgi:hypothetical protein